MKIQYKSDPNIRREVEPAILNERAGWMRTRQDLIIFYPSTHWEPVEEWVSIEVRKEDLDKVNDIYKLMGVEKGQKYNEYKVGLVWRKPQ